MKVTEPVDRGLLPLLCLLMPAVKVTVACNKGNNAQQQLILILLFCRSASLVSFLPLSDLLRYSASSLLCFRRVGLLWVSSPSPLLRVADRAALLADGGSVAGCGRRCSAEEGDRGSEAMENGPARSLVGGDEAVLLCGLVEAGVDGDRRRRKMPRRGSLRC
jgi:hypothetical protein